MRSLFPRGMAPAAHRFSLVLGFVLAACGGSACGGKAVIDGEPSTTTTTSSSSGGGSMGGGNIRSIELDSAFGFADCFPGGGGGELDVEFEMTFVNAGTEAATLVIEEARIQGMAGVTTFAVAPASVSVSANSTQSFEFVKDGPGAGTRGCQWCNAIDAQLEVEFTIDGAARTFSDAFDSISCSF